jgi:hypothetical protein
MKAVFALLLLHGFAGPALAEELSFRWQEIPNSLLRDRKVEVRLAGKEKLHGRALEARADGLRMQITNAHGSAKYQIGEALVNASEIEMLKVSRTGQKGRIIGASIGGGIAGLIAWAAIAQGESGEGLSSAPGVTAGLAAGSLGAGYLLGWARDHKVTTIHVARE